jgi:hypothetical protein
MKLCLKITRNALLAAVIAAFCGVSAFAQSFTTSVSSNTVGVNEQLQVTFTFSGEDINGIKNFRPPDFKEFLTLSGPNQSTNMSIINGSVSGSRSFSYIIQPRQMGRATIGSASVDYKGKNYQTSPVKIDVVKGSPQQNQSRNQAQKDQSVSQKEIGENLFIKASADRQKVLKGEQINVTYKLYTALQMSSPQISKLPSYPGFWAEETEAPTNINFTIEKVNGKPFHVAVLKKVALFPTETGELSVTPFALKIPVYLQKKRRSNNPFDDFFNDPFFSKPEVVEYNAVSNTIKVSVQPLPSNNVPHSFTGAVGDFTLKVDVDKTKVKTNEPITLKVKISGTGNIKLLTLPEFEIPAGFEKYDPKVDEDLNKSGRISGNKNAEYLLIPRFAGKKEIPGVSFSFYNPAKKQYQTITSNPITIDVEQGEGGVSQSGSALSKEDIKLLNEDILYIKTSGGDIKEKDSYLFKSFFFWLLAVLPLAGLVALLVFRRREEKLASNMQNLLYQRAQKMARKKLKTAKKYLDVKDENRFYTELSSALFGYLENKLGISKADFTLDGALNGLKERNVSDELVESVGNIARKCEFIRFAPKTEGADPMQEIYDEAVKIIIDVEKSLA